MPDRIDSIRVPLSAARSERIARCAADAASAVPGVHHLGADSDPSIAATFRRDLLAGVRVADRLDGVEVLLQVVADYPVNVTTVANHVLAHVWSALAEIGEGDVIVAVTVADVHGPWDQAASEQETTTAAPVVERAEAGPITEGVPAARHVPATPQAEILSSSGVPEERS